MLFFQGWVPAERESAVGAFLTENGCAWETRDPTEEEIPDVPVQLKNNWFTKPLNMVTEMYSLPRYDNVDPNPLMAPFFIFFYGVMMADMGYGLIMFLAGFLITKKYHPKGTMGNLFGLMTLCGVSHFYHGRPHRRLLRRFSDAGGKAYHRAGLYTPLGLYPAE